MLFVLVECNYAMKPMRWRKLVTRMLAVFHNLNQAMISVRLCDGANSVRTCFSFYRSTRYATAFGQGFRDGTIISYLRAPSTFWETCLLSLRGVVGEFVEIGCSRTAPSRSSWAAASVLWRAADDIGEAAASNGSEPVVAGHEPAGQP